MSPIGKLIFYSMAMIIVPVTSYFAAQKGFSDLTDVGAHWVNIYSAIVAVVFVHVILISFVIMAYREDKDVKASETAKKDD